MPDHTRRRGRDPVVAVAEVAGGAQHGGAGRTGRTLGVVEHRTGPDADVAGAPGRPATEVGRDGVEGLGCAQAGPVAATSAMQTCACVSSEYSPGS
ncbi:hypothetical protein [Streptomyces anandii]|uniref:hypothetical protein n=1 Tax=Streptomyces anandii TaxID=285454 RepID=UPI0037A498EE